jgi:nucleotide-binding universal stress UspA family protein
VKRLLVGYDGSEPARAAAQLAGRLAKQLGASVTVLTSGHAVTTVGKRLVPTDDATVFLPTAEEGADLVRTHGVVADARSERGDPAPTLINAAHRGEYDLMLVGHRGLGGLRGLFLGSTAKQVATEAPCPVLVLRETAPDTIRNVLVATDGSAHALHAVEAAAPLARALGARVTLLYVRDTAALAACTDPTAMLRLAATLKETGIQALARGREVCQRAEVHCTAVEVEGHPAETIYKQVRYGDYDLVAVGRRGKSALDRLTLGSVSDVVLRDAHQPVLVAGEQVRSQPDKP